MPILTARQEDAFALPANASHYDRPSQLYQWIKRLARRMAIRRQRQVLHTMPDWILKDVGINRSEIDSLSVRLVDGEADPTCRPRGFVSPKSKGARR